MARSKVGSFIKNDLKIVSLFCIFALLLVSAMEVTRSGDLQSQWSVDGDDGDNGDDGWNATPVDIEVESTTGRTNEGQTRDQAFALDYYQVTDIEVTLTWTDDYGNNDLFSVTLLWEGEEESSEQADSGTIILSVNDADGGYNGNFTVEITAIDCPGRVTASPVDLDDGNDWELQVTATVIEEGPP
jgi:hypothetical protein